MLRFVRQLKAAGVRPQIVWIDGTSAKPPGLELLLDLERLTLRRLRPCGSDPVATSAFDEFTAPQGTPDMVVDFTDADPAGLPPKAVSKPKCWLRPLFDGRAGENAALDAILQGRMPLIEIRDELSNAVIDRGVASSEDAVGLGGAFEAVMARILTLVNATLHGAQRLAPPQMSAAADSPPRSPAGFVGRGLALGVAQALYRLCCYPAHWHVGWRYTDDDGIWARGDLSGASFSKMPDPGHRFFADPFAATWQGKTFVFVEDLDHRVGKGVISAQQFGDAGPSGPMTPVLEEPWHLSYPFLIEHAGALWMIPESTANRDVAIYRSVRFPDQWERHATLLSGLEAADVTIIRHGGRFYLFAATRDGWGGYSDTLSIFHADDLFGPWRPHAANPILVDRTAARPAGAFAHKGGVLWRPVQDCTDGYGSALGLAEIIELSPTAFRQTVRHVIRPGPRWPGRKLHTLNRCGRLEVIDGSVYRPKLQAAAKLLEAASARSVAGG